MFGHDDIILNFQHRIELVDAVLEFFFHHLPDGGKFHVGSVRVSVGFVQLTCYLTEGLAECSDCGNGDVVIAFVTIVVGKAAPLHAVDGGFADGRFHVWGI